VRRPACSGRGWFVTQFVVVSGNIHVNFLSSVHVIRKLSNTDVLAVTDDIKTKKLLENMTRPHEI